MKKIQRLLSALLVLCMVMTLSPTTAWATDSDFTIDENGVLTKYNGAGGDVTISERVLRIGENAFSSTGISSVTIPSSVTTIDSGAFSYCQNLTAVFIPKSVNEICYDAFKGCSLDIYYEGTETDWERIDRRYSNDYSHIATMYYNSTEIGNGTGEASNTCGENLTWELENGTLTINGTGAMKDYGAVRAPWYNQRDTITTVIIAEGVTSIGKSAFSDCSSLTKLVIPSSVNSIGGSIDGSCFEGCTGLTSAGPIGGGYNIEFDWAGNTSFGFSNCYSLTTVTIPNGVEYIDSWAFYGCSNLTTVIIPDTVRSFGRSAFYGCKISDVYYSGNEEQWAKITRDDYVSLPITGDNIHYNSTGPVTPDPGPDAPSDNYTSVYFLSGWDAATRKVQFGDSALISPDTYTVADNVDVSNISSLLNKYVLVTMEQGDSSLEYTITDIQPVESRIGTVSATGEHSLTIDGATYPVREDFLLASLDGKEVLYHIYNGTIMGFDTLEAKTGTLEAWDDITGRATIDRKDYPTNFLSDVSNLNQAAGRKITYYFVNSIEYSPLMKYTLLNDTESVPCEQVGAALRVGEELNTFYYDFEQPAGTPMPSVDESNVSVFVGDETILQIEKTEYFRNDENGVLSVQYTVKANHTGTTTITVYANGVAVKKWEIQVEIDRWRFLNANDQEGGQWPHADGYYISMDDYLRLVSNLSSVDRAKITRILPMYSWYNINGITTAFRKWSGSCSGMSRWACLVGSGTLSPNLFNQKKLYEEKNLSLEIQSAINFYHHQQQLFSWEKEVDKFMSLSQTEQIENLKACATAAENDGSPIYIGFQWYKDSNTKKPSAHAIVGYGIEDGFWNMEVNGQKLGFTHRVLIYDCNLPANVFNSNLYFNDSGVWCIPKYNAISSDNGIGGTNNNAQFKIITNNSALINLIDFETGKVSSAGTGELIRNGTLSVPSDIIYTLFSGEDAYKIGGVSVLQSTSNKKLNIMLDCNITPTGENIPSNATVILPDTNSEYTVTTEDRATGFSLDYGNYLETVSLGSHGSITFKPNGSLTIQTADATDYGLSVTANEGYTPLPWHTISVTGSGVTELSTESVAEGVVLHSDNLNDVTVYGTDDNETKELEFSTQEDSVLITEKSDELVILADNDNDGTYETPVETISKPTYTITFNANGGAVTSATSTTDTVGKLATLPTPTRNSYTFDGWYTVASGGEKITTDYIFTSDTMVYAHWTYVGTSSPTTPSVPSNPGGWYPGNYNPPASSYSVSAPSVTGGTVSVNPTSATAGSTVTITATPDAGYELTALTVNDANGKSLELANKGDGKYSFKMPNGKVSLNAEFRPVSSEAPWNNPFTDISPSAWYYDAVKFVNQNGLMNGAGNGLFVPDAYLSRAMLAEILYNKKGRPAMPDGVATFPDVSLNGWYTNAVTWAYGRGIIKGYDNGLFGPGDDITREQLAVMLYRYAGSPVPPNLQLNFIDAHKVSSWAQDAMCWAVSEGVLSGKGNGILDPTGKATRAEAAQMLKNYLDK